jgi:hypothetical protein
MRQPQRVSINFPIVDRRSVPLNISIRRTATLRADQPVALFEDDPLAILQTRSAPHEPQARRRAPSIVGAPDSDFTLARALT